jgi:hypothetical protein
MTRSKRVSFRSDEARIASGALVILIERAKASERASGGFAYCVTLTT